MPLGPIGGDPPALKLKAWPGVVLSQLLRRRRSTRASVGLVDLRENWWWTVVASPDCLIFRSCLEDWSGTRKIGESDWKEAARGPATMKVLVASKNPVKVNAVTTAFQRVFPDTFFQFQSVGVPSDVREQPWGNEETLRGARNRVKNAVEMAEAADFVVAIEGGLEWCSFTKEPQLMCFAWAVVLSRDVEGKARAAAFMLPPPLAELIAGGMEMSGADDKLFGRTNSKCSNGTVGLLTREHITRETYYEHAVTMALIPFINPELFYSPSLPVLPAGAVVTYD